MKKQISTLSGIIVIILVAVVFFGAVFVCQHFLIKPQTVIQPQKQNSGTVGWKTYANAGYGFEFKYPADLKVFNDNSGGAYISTWDVLSESSDVLVGLNLYSKDTVESFGWENRKGSDNQAIVKNGNGDMMLITIGFDKSSSIKSVFNGVANTFKFIK